MPKDNCDNRVHLMLVSHADSLGFLLNPRVAFVTLSVRIENIEQRREVRSSNSSHGEDEGYEEDEGRWRNERYKERRIHRRYGVYAKSKSGLGGLKI